MLLCVELIVYTKRGVLKEQWAFLGSVLKPSCKSFPLMHIIS